MNATDKKLSQQRNLTKLNRNIHNFEFNGSATIEIIVDGDKINSDEYELGAFYGDECVGVTKPIIFPMTDSYVFPLMVYSNENTSNISFKLYDKENDRFLSINNGLEFIEDMHLGNGYEPVVIQASDIVPTEIVVSAPYPNPFNPSVNLDVQLFNQEYIKASIYNLNGQLIETVYDGLMSQGNNQLTWHAGNNSSGIYFVNIEGQNGSIVNYKISLLK